MLPLSRVRVLELARVLAGPWAGQLLSELGADVIKVESPDGDETRHWSSGSNKNKQTSYFKSTNRGKKSLVADLNSLEDLTLVKKLALKADIIIENFKVGNLRRFDLDYETVSKLNPRIIYCSITGFGQNGPYCKQPGYDFIIQAMGGIMDITGESDGPPQKPGVAYADLFTGVYSVVAIQAALYSREKNGVGTHIDMALFDTQLGVLANQAASFQETGIAPIRLGNTHPSIVPYQVFNTADAALVIACGNDKQFIDLCRALKVEFHKDPKFKSNPNRVKNRAELVFLIEDITKKLTKAEIIETLRSVSVPVGSINNIAEAFSDPQAIHRKMSSKINGDPFVRTPIVYSNLKMSYKRTPPNLGQDTKEIYEHLKKNNLWED